MDQEKPWIFFYSSPPPHSRQHGWTSTKFDDHPLSECSFALKKLKIKVSDPSDQQNKFRNVGLWVWETWPHWCLWHKLLMCVKLVKWKSSICMKPLSLICSIFEESRQLSKCFGWHFTPILPAVTAIWLPQSAQFKKYHEDAIKLAKSTWKNVSYDQKRSTENVKMVSKFTKKISIIKVLSWRWICSF